MNEELRFYITKLFLRRLGDEVPSPSTPSPMIITGGNTPRTAILGSEPPNRATRSTSLTITPSASNQVTKQK